MANTLCFRFTFRLEKLKEHDGPWSSVQHMRFLCHEIGEPFFFLSFFDFSYKATLTPLLPTQTEAKKSFHLLEQV